MWCMYICVQHAQARGGCCRSFYRLKTELTELPTAPKARPFSLTGWINCNCSTPLFLLLVLLSQGCRGNAGNAVHTGPRASGLRMFPSNEGRGTGIPQLSFCKLFVTSYTLNLQCLDFLPQRQTSLFPSLQFTAFLPSMIK